MSMNRCALIICLLTICVTGWARLPSPPQQPTSGPGGSDYFARGTIYSRYSEQNIVYWIITPDDPKPERAPVAIFCPDAGEIDPGSYRGWIDHLVRRGFIVIYPVIPQQSGEDPAGIAQSMQAMIESARQHISQSTTTTAAWELLFYIGHGTGGVNAYNLACDDGIKQSVPPKALLIVQPYRETSGIRREAMPLANASKLGAGCSVMLLTGADDDNASDSDARLLGQMLAAGIPSDRFCSITIRSDRHGNPPLVADHYMAFAKLGDRGRLRMDALDWFGVWRMADLLADQAFSEGKIFTSDEDLRMGNWSDGLMVNTMVLNKLK